MSDVLTDQELVAFLMNQSAESVNQMRKIMNTVPVEKFEQVSAIVALSREAKAKRGPKKKESVPTD